MPKPSSNKSSFAVAKVNQGYAVIQLLAVRDGKAVLASDQAQYQAFSEQIQMSQGLLEYTLYKDSLMAKAKIVNLQSS